MQRDVCDVCGLIKNATDSQYFPIMKIISRQVARNTWALAMLHTLALIDVFVKRVMGLGLRWVNLIFVRTHFAINQGKWTQLWGGNTRGSCSEKGGTNSRGKAEVASFGLRERRQASSLECK